MRAVDQKQKILLEWPYLCAITIDNKTLAAYDFSTQQTAILLQGCIFVPAWQGMTYELPS